MNSAFKSEKSRTLALAAYDKILQHWPIPYESRFINTSFGPTHAIISGPIDAPPLILLHGAGGNAMMWIFNVTELAKHYRVYAIDMIGEANKSASTRPTHASGQYADWLKEVSDQAGIKQAVVCGASLGGTIAQQFALKHPSYVSKLIMLAPPSIVSISKVYLYRALLAAALPDLFGRNFLSYLSARRDYPDYILESFICQMKAYRPNLDVIPLMTDQDLQKLEGKTMVIFGDEEVIYNPMSAANRIRQIAPGIEVVMLPGAKHLTSMERPEVVDAKVIGMAR